MNTQAHPRDRWIPWYFVAFFVVVAAVMAGMVTAAVKTQTGLVTDHAYEKGLAYNRTIAAFEEQERLGWTGALSRSGETVAFTLKDRDGKPVTGVPVTLSVVRPTHDGMDFAVTLKEDALGHYAGSVHYPLSGAWELRVHAGEVYQFAERVVIR